MAEIKFEQPRGGGDSIPQMLQWMPAPGLANSSPGMPLSLSYLAEIDTLSVQQEPSAMQSILHRLFSSICSFIIFWIAITGLSSAQRFQILNGQGQLVFYAAESKSKLFKFIKRICMNFITLYFSTDESDTCHRWCCGARRGFVIHVIDRMNQVRIYKTDSFFLIFIIILGSYSHFSWI